MPQKVRIFMWVADTADPYESMPEGVLERLGRLHTALALCAGSLAKEQGDPLGIFMAPEWLFRTTEPYTEKDKDTAFGQVKRLSEMYGNIVIVPGSLTWHKAIDGRFAWLNTSIVAWDGEVHYYNKRHDHDNFYGYHECYPYFEARKALFEQLQTQYDPDQVQLMPSYLKSWRDFSLKYRDGIPYQTLSKMIRDARLDQRVLEGERKVSNLKLLKPALLKWEYRENGRTRTFEESDSQGLQTWKTTPGEKRLLFSEYSSRSFFGMKNLTFCIETCADYSHATAAREYVQEYPAGMGVDLHLVVANGIMPGNTAEGLAAVSVARPGGLLMICNAHRERRYASCVVSVSLRHETIEKCFLAFDQPDPYRYIVAGMRVPGERDIVPGFGHLTNVHSPTTHFRDWIYDYRDAVLS
jgi:hypothetical protein